MIISSSRIHVTIAIVVVIVYGVVVTVVLDGLFLLLVKIITECLSLTPHCLPAPFQTKV